MQDHSTLSTTCLHCGCQYTPRSDSSGKYCSYDCYHASRRRRPANNHDGTAAVPLTKGFVATIDADDIDKVSRYSWYAKHNKYGTYAVARVHNRLISMHRYLLQPQAGLHVDHVDGDGLNNRRANLRTCTHRENMRNARVRKDSVSMYKGVGYDKRRGKWRARIKCSTGERWLGYFDTPLEAARAYDTAASKEHGEFAVLNFPDD